MKHFLRLLSLAILLLAGLPASAVLAQSAPPIVEPCDKRSAPGWKASQTTTYENGVCVFNNSASLQPDKISFTDYNLTFRIRFENGSQVSLVAGQMMGKSFAFTLSADSVQMNRIQRYGNASSTENVTNLGAVKINLPLNEWVDIRLSLRDTTFSVLQSDRLLKSWTVDRVMSGGFMLTGSGSTAAWLDDITLTPVSGAVATNQLESLTGELLQTWIAFIKNGNEVWLVHPDGSGLRKSPTPNGNPAMKLAFSPQGNALGFLESSGETLRLRVLILPDFKMIEPGVLLKRGAAFTWSPDESQVAVFDETKLNGVYTIRIIDVKTGQTVRELPLPAEIDGMRLEYLNLQQILWSPVKNELFLKISFYEKNMQYMDRAMLMDLSNGQMTRLPISGAASWAPDGKRLVASEGGWLDLSAMIFHDFDTALGNYVSYDTPIWSPNGQLIASWGKEKMSIIDMAAQSVIFSKETSYERRLSWSPSSQQIVYADNMRIFVQDILTKKEQQIAEGADPQWQPAPKLSQAAVIAPTKPVPTALPVQKEPTPTSAAVKATAERATTPVSAPQKEAEPPPGAASTGRSPLLILGILIGIAGIGLLLAFFLLPYLPMPMKCPNCAKTVSSKDAHCMYCGMALPQGTRRVFRLNIAISRMWWMGLGAALLLAAAIVAFALSAARPSPPTTEQAVKTQVPAAVAAVTVVITQIPEATAAKKAGEPTAVAPEPEAQCGGAPLSSTPLNELLQAASGSSMTTIMEKIGKLPTQEQGQANIEKILGQMCMVDSLAISPDGQKIAAHMLSPNGNWLAIYDSGSLKPITADAAADITGRIAWSPDGARLAYENREGIMIVSPGAGSAVTIPKSTRESKSCALSDNYTSYQWLSGGKQITRKVNGGVEVFDAASGEKLRDVPTDDALMGVLSFDIHQCGYRAVFSPDGNRFATITTTFDSFNAENNNKINIWDTNTGAKVAELAHSARIESVFWSPDSASIYVESMVGAGPNLVYSLSGGKQEFFIPPGAGAFYDDFRWSLDNSKFLISGHDASMVCDAATLNCSALPAAPNNTLMKAVDWLPDGQRALFTDKGGAYVYYVFDTKSNQWSEFSQLRSLH